MNLNNNFTKEYEPKPKSLIPGFHLMLMLVMLSIPFGELQQKLLNGFSPAKVIIPFLFFYLLCIKTKNLKIHPILLPYCLFVILTFPSFVTGINFFGVALSLIGYILLFQVLYHYSGSFYKIRSLIIAYMVGLLIVGLLTLQIFITGIDPGVYLGKPFIEFWIGSPLVSGTSNNPNGFATLFMPGVIISFALFLCSERKLHKLFYGISLVILFATLVMTLSRSAIGASLLSCVVVHHHLRNQSTFSIYLLLKLAVTLILIIFLSSVYYLIIDLITTEAVGISSTQGLLSNKEQSGGYRTEVLIPMLSIIIENPTGVGFGNIKYIMEAKTGLFINSHNTPFGIAMDYGIFTLFFLLITIIQAFRYYAKGIIFSF